MALSKLKKLLMFELAKKCNMDTAFDAEKRLKIFVILPLTTRNHGCFAKIHRNYFMM